MADREKCPQPKSNPFDEQEELNRLNRKSVWREPKKGPVKPMAHPEIPIDKIKPVTLDEDDLPF